jgi:hypothetical protein
MLRSILLACSLPLLVACRPTVCGTGRYDDHEPPSDPFDLYLEHEPVRLPQRSDPMPTVITHGECPADTASELTSYLQGAMRLRLPAGVTADNFVELTPSFARLAGPVESTNCHEGMPGGLINYMLLAQFERAPYKSQLELRVELLEAAGYPENTLPFEGGEQSPGFELWAYDVPRTDLNPEPAKMLLALWITEGRVFALIYECHSAAWSVLVNTFVDSASRVELAPIVRQP